MSESSLIPPPMLEKHQMEVEHLKWQIEYESKFQQEMNRMLEDKVSNLMATKDENNKKIEALMSEITSLNEELARLNGKID